MSTIWILGIEPASFRRAASALTMEPSPQPLFFQSGQTYKVKSQMLALFKQSFTDQVTDTGRIYGQYKSWTVNVALTFGPLFVGINVMLVASINSPSYIRSQMPMPLGPSWVQTNARKTPELPLPMLGALPGICLFPNLVLTLLNTMCSSEVKFLSTV